MEKLRSCGEVASQQPGQLVSRLSNEYLTLRIALVIFLAMHGNFFVVNSLVDEDIGVAARSSRSRRNHAEEGEP